jgi:plasmid stability protein
MLSFLADNKDAIIAIGNIGIFIQSLVTMLAVIVGGGWALHRFTKERPFEANVKLRMDVGISEFDEARRILRVTIILENAGLAAIRLGDSRVTDHRGRLAVRAVKVEHSHSGEARPVAVLSWENSPDTVALFDEPFVDVFKEWFPDGKSYTLEAKETAELCRDLVVSKEFEIVNIFVMVYEGIIREAGLKRPYYWVLERTFDLTRGG